MTPENNLERALVSARFGPEGIVVNPKTEEEQKVLQYEGVLSQIESPERLIELQLRLEEDLPYFQISSDESIRDYFTRFGVQITDKRDLQLFSYALANQIDSLDKTDERVGPSLENLSYRRQLHQFPKVLSDLEKTVSDFSSLNAPFDVALHYAWEAVQKKGFKMDEKGENATDPYDAQIIIEPYPGESIHFLIKINDSDSLEFYLHPKYKTRKAVVRKGFWKQRVIVEEDTGESKGLGIIPLKIFDRKWNKNIEKRNYKGVSGITQYDYPVLAYMANNLHKDELAELVRFDAERMLKVLVDHSLIIPDLYMKSLQTYLGIILRLPKIMHNYVERTKGDLIGILNSGLEQVKEKEESR